MPAVGQLALFWALAFVSLCMAVTLLNVYSGIIDSDLTLHSAGKEAAIAAAASLVEAGSVWSILSFVPGATRALIIPVLVVALIYKVSHLEEWSRYDVVMLLVFQGVIAGSGAALFFGHWMLAMVLVGALIFCLGIMAAITRSL